MTFANPEYLLLLLLVVPMLLAYFFLRGRQEPTLKVATTETYRQPVHTLRSLMVHSPFVLRLIVVVLIIVALARPQTNFALRESETEGIDIIMAMDVSTSMLTQDVKPNRITAAKAVASEFVGNRPHDNIGLVLFGGEAYMQCPLTTDHTTLLSMFTQVNCDLQQAGLLAQGTAIGMGLTNAVAHLEGSQAKSKIVILLTDGVNNTGDISPQMAAEVAKDCGVRVYCISLGTTGKTLQQIATLPNGSTYEAEVENTTDADVLEQIAQLTDGKAYHAESKEELSQIYSEIDRLEKTKLKVLAYDKRFEAYAPIALLAFVLLLVEWILRVTWLRRLP